MKLRINIKLYRPIFAATLLISPTEYSAINALDSYTSALELIANPLAIFSARSPGARGTSLIQTKNLYGHDDYWGMAPENGPVPDNAYHDRGVSDYSYADFTMPLNVDPLAFDSTPLDVLLGLHEPPGAAGLPGSYGDSWSPDSAGGRLRYDGSGPASSPTAPPIPPILPPRETAVPEPETWLMMIGGFFAVGSLLRLKNGRRTRTGEE